MAGKIPANMKPPPIEPPRAAPPAAQQAAQRQQAAPAQTLQQQQQQLPRTAPRPPTKPLADRPPPLPEMAESWFGTNLVDWLVRPLFASHAASLSFHLHNPSQRPSNQTHALIHATLCALLSTPSQLPITAVIIGFISIQIFKWGNVEIPTLSSTRYFSPVTKTSALSVKLYKTIEGALRAAAAAAAATARLTSTQAG